MKPFSVSRLYHGYIGSHSPPGQSRRSTVPATTLTASLTSSPLSHRTVPTGPEGEAQPLEAAGNGVRSGENLQCPIDLTAENTLQDQAAADPQAFQHTVGKAENAKKSNALVERIRQGFADAKIAYENAVAKRSIATVSETEGDPTDGTLEEGDKGDKDQQKAATDM